MRSLHEDLCMSLSVLLIIKSALDRFIENIKARLLASKAFVRKSCLLWY